MSSAAPSTSNAVDDSAIDQVMTVTAVERSRAEALLATSGGNVERAINLFFEASSAAAGQADCGHPPGTSDTVQSESSPVDVVDEQSVRAPILPRADIIAEAGHDAANYTQLDWYSSGSHRRRFRRHPNPHRTDSVFDKFRDFSAEIKWQEQNLGRMGRARAGSSSSVARAVGSNGRGDNTKRRTLEEMFRPPLELLCMGTFQLARDRGVAQRRWLLVNVQNTAEFACQTLNRDVWSQPTVADLIRRRFVLWQVYHESGEGLKYRTFYPVSRWPYVAAIDPRTGELLRVWHWQQQDSDSVLQQLNDFLTAHTYDGDEGECPGTSSTTTTTNSTTSSDGGLPPQKRMRTNSALVDLDEDAQIRMAIERSLRANQKAATVDSSESSSCGDSPRAEVSGKESPPGLTEDADSTEAVSVNADDCEARSLSTTEPTSVRVCVSPTQGCSSRVNSTPSDLSEVGDSAPSIDGTTGEWKQFLGSPDDPLWTVALRMPDSRRLQLQLPSSSLLRSVQLYAGEQLGCAAGTLELVTTFPRRRLSQPELLTQTLEEVGLHSQDTLFVQKL